MDLVEQSHAEDAADAGHREQESERVGILHSGLGEQVALEVGDQDIVLIDELEIGGDALGDGRIVEAQLQVFAVLGEGNATEIVGEVVLIVDGVQVGEQLGALADEVKASAQEIARRSHGAGIDVSLREGAAAQESGDFERVDAVVLGLGAMDGLHVQSVTEDELDVLDGAEIGEPVPGIHTLGAHYEVLAIGSDGS
jgi:hypothetical protein